jgi:hypothetical protein
VICPNCALFGSHKGHDYFKFEDFKEKCQLKLKELKTEMERTELKWYIQEGGREAEAMRKRVSNKKEELNEQVDSVFAYMIKKMEDRKKDLKQEISEKFRKFERIIDLRVTHHENISGRVNSFGEKLKDAENKLEQKSLNFESMFVVFFQKGSKNAFEEFEKIAQEIEIEKNNNSSFVEKELGRYKIESDQSTINSFVKQNIARLTCEVTSIGESLKNITSLVNNQYKNFINKKSSKVNHLSTEGNGMERIVQSNQEDSFEKQLINGIQIAENIKLMGSNFGSKIFSNINMAEFVKKNDLINANERIPKNEQDNIFKEEALQGCSQTERKKKKMIHLLENNFSEKKHTESSNRICEKEIDAINNSNVHPTSNLMTPKSTVDYKNISKNPKQQIMSFLDHDMEEHNNNGIMLQKEHHFKEEEENLMSSSFTQIDEPLNLKNDETFFTPKKNRKIAFNLENMDDPNESNLYESANKEQGRNIKFKKQNKQFINMLKKEKGRNLHQRISCPQQVLQSICFNRPKASGSMRNMILETEPEKEANCKPLNLYNRFSTQRNGSSSKNKNSKNISMSPLLGLDSSEQIYTHKPRKSILRGKRLKMKGGMSLAKGTSKLNESSSKKTILRRKKGRTNGGSKSINGMNSLIQFKNKNLRIETEARNKNKFR